MHIYLCICICICTRICVCICICIHVYMYVYVYVYAYVYICVCMYACVRVHVYMYMCMYIHKSICILAESQHALSMRALVAWRGGLFLKEGTIGVLSVVFSSFHAGGSVCGCMCVCTHTHTHTTQMGNLDVSSGVGQRHLEEPKDPDGLNLGIHIFVYVYKVHMCIYILRGGMRSWTNCFCF